MIIVNKKIGDLIPIPAGELALDCFCKMQNKYRILCILLARGENSVIIKTLRTREAHDRDFSTFTKQCASFEETTLRQFSQVIFGMLVASGRITMMGLLVRVT